MCCVPPLEVVTALAGGLSWWGAGCRVNHCSFSFRARYKLRCPEVTKGGQQLLNLPRCRTQPGASSETEFISVINDEFREDQTLLSTHSPTQLWDFSRGHFVTSVGTARAGRMLRPSLQCNSPSSIPTEPTSDKPGGAASHHRHEVNPTGLRSDQLSVPHSRTGGDVT